MTYLSNQNEKVFILLFPILTKKIYFSGFLSYENEMREDKRVHNCVTFCYKSCYFPDEVWYDIGSNTMYC